jgi:hypothetical protein
MVEEFVQCWQMPGLLRQQHEVIQVSIYIFQTVGMGCKERSCQLQRVDGLHGGAVGVRSG